MAGGKRSIKTTISGVAMIVAAVAYGLVALTDTDPATNPDWAAMASQIKDALVALGVLSGGVLGILAADNSDA